MKNTKQLRITHTKKSGILLRIYQSVWTSRLDFFLWSLLSLVLVFVCFFSVSCPFFSSSDSLTSLFIIMGLIFLLFIIRFTTQGSKGWKFLLGTRLEMQKVIWPTRKEIINSTFVILVIILLSSILIYFIGFLFMYIMHCILI
jgi:preprotein translocase subunit SecE